METSPEELKKLERAYEAVSPIREMIAVLNLDHSKISVDKVKTLKELLIKSDDIMRILRDSAAKLNDLGSVAKVGEIYRSYQNFVNIYVTEENAKQVFNIAESLFSKMDKTNEDLKETIVRRNQNRLAA